LWKVTRSTSPARTSVGVLGTASDLLGALGEVAGERVAKSKTWPDNPRALSGRLRRAATFLRKIGIETSFQREGRERTRIICITTTGNNLAPEPAGARPSAPSASSPPIWRYHVANGFPVSAPRTVANDADGKAGDHAPTRPHYGIGIWCQDRCGRCGRKSRISTAVGENRRDPLGC
jgi:hypothetical protein